MLAAVVLMGAVWVLHTRATQSRESFLPVLRAAKDHGRQAERLAAKAVPVSADEERRGGEAVVARLDGMSREDEGLTALGRRLERTGLAPHFAGRYRYRLLQDSRPLAFSVPGGSIYISEGMVTALAGQQDRLAFVLGHEIGHNELGHLADRVRYAQRFDSWLLPGGDLAQGLRDLAAFSFGPALEFEADSYALRILTLADLRPGAAAETLEAIAGRPAPDPGTHADPADMLVEALRENVGTHPDLEDRLDRIEEDLGRAPAGALSSAPAPGHPVFPPVPSPKP
ncbi:MAG: hypothetical protein A2X36_02855 [Elusimicrobia bacterium GWA2_69_24]|nr:MAG: hypothetical protein A2X36_02855 [Elusimicrobia bacterium GWA2_69_24]